MVDVFTEIIIHKPIDLVADYVANPENSLMMKKATTKDMKNIKRIIENME